MTKPTVYVETTVVGYLTSRPQSNVTVESHQELTRRWWKSASNRFDLLVSELVLLECGAGDAIAAAERLKAIDSLQRLPTNDDAELLAAHLILRGAVPATQARDALHIAIAATHGVKYLVTWNFRHIANAAMLDSIEAACLERECLAPRICTPESLLEE